MIKKKKHNETLLETLLGWSLSLLHISPSPRWSRIALTFWSSCRDRNLLYLWSAKPTQPTCDIEISVLFLCKRRLDVKWKPYWSACNKVVPLMFFVMSRCRRLTTTTVCTNICSTGIISNYMNTHLYNFLYYKYTGHFAYSVWWTMWPSPSAGPAPLRTFPQISSPAMPATCTT